MCGNRISGAASVVGLSPHLELSFVIPLKLYIPIKFQIEFDEVLHALPFEYFKSISGVEYIDM